MKKTFADILSEQQREAGARMARKVPEWAGYALQYPSRLSTEQCSSSATALYKAALMQRIAGQDEPRIADITGGLGVDCWAFAKVASAVLHNEMNEELSAAVRSNFEAMGLDGKVSFSSICITEETLMDALGGFSPTIVFADPARREAGTGRKVFRLEDCTPDILTLKDVLLAIAGDVVIKLSPMADISLVCRSLGECVREVHVIGTGGPCGECKELLIWMQRGWRGGVTITVADAECGCISFTPAEEAQACALIAGAVEPGSMLIEPSAALMKGGCHALLSSRYGLRKLGASTHLYVGDGLPEALTGLCKCHRIKEVLPLSGSTIKEVGKRYPQADVTSRNIPMSSDELRVRMKVKPGDGIHIFGCQSDALGRLLIVTERA